MRQPSRKPVAVAERKVRTYRASDAEHLFLSHAAQLSGRRLADWALSTLLKAAARETRRSPPPRITTVEPPAVFPIAKLERGPRSLRALAQQLHGEAPHLVLIGCGYRKELVRSPAAALYTGPLFRESLAYARALGAPVAILSGLYGVVAPGRMIDPYDLNVKDLSAKDLKAWSVRVLKALSLVAGPRRLRVTVLAFGGYVTPWAEDARWRGWTVEAPFLGAGGLKVSAWLTSETRRLEALQRPASAPGPVRRTRGRASQLDAA
jgi:hypothetical protein